VFANQHHDEAVPVSEDSADESNYTATPQRSPANARNNNQTSHPQSPGTGMLQSDGRNTAVCIAALTHVLFIQCCCGRSRTATSRWYQRVGSARICRSERPCCARSCTCTHATCYTSHRICSKHYTGTCVWLLDLMLLRESERSSLQ